MEIKNNKLLKNQYHFYFNGYDGAACHPLSLDEAYSRPSAAKRWAWRRCEKLRDLYNGYGLYILGYNCMQFSVGFIGYINGLRYFFYITRDHDRCMPLEKMDPVTGEVIQLY